MSGDLWKGEQLQLDDMPSGVATDAEVTAVAGAYLPKAGGQMTGNITMAGAQTVDGRDLSVDGAKLDGIAAGAAALTSDTPSALGSAAVGNGTTAARSNHVHAMPSAADVGADPAGTSSTHAALTTAHGATDANTASRIVMRDASGNFSAGTITASLTGTASGNLTQAGADLIYAPIAKGVTNGDSHDHSGGDGGALVASSIGMTRVGSSTYSTVQQSQDIYHSAGWTSGGTITDAGGATINVAAGTGLIRTSASAVASLPYSDWVASNGISIPSDTVRWVGVEYNAGAPQVTVRTSNNFNRLTDFALGLVVNEGGTLYIHQAEHKVGDHAGIMVRAMRETMPLARDEETGGLILTESADTNRYVALSAGALWDGLNRFAVAAINTSGADRFTTYKHVGGVWTATTGVQVWPNTQYDNGTDLVTMTANRYGDLWFYVTDSGALLMLYGTAEYTNAAQAEAASVPSSLPDRVRYTARLVGRLVFQKSATTAVEVQSAFETVFAATQAAVHNNLGSIQGGTSGEYYHLTSAQHSVATDATLTALAGMTTAANDILFFSASDTPDPKGIGELTEASTVATTDLFLMEVGGNVRKVQAGNAGQLIGTTPSTSTVTWTTRTADLTLTANTGNLLDAPTLGTTLKASVPATVADKVEIHCANMDNILGSVIVGPSGSLAANGVSAPWVVGLTRNGSGAEIRGIGGTSLAVRTDGAVTPMSGYWIPGRLAAGAVSSWVDVVAGTTFSQGTGANQPTMSATAYNLRPGITCDGGDHLQASAPLIATPQAFWAAAVFRAHANTSRILFAQDDIAVAEGRHWRMDYTTNANQFRFAVLDSGGDFVATTFNTTSGTTYFVISIWDGTTATSSITTYAGTGGNLTGVTSTNTGTFNTPTWSTATPATMFAGLNSGAQQSAWPASAPVHGLAYGLGVPSNSAIQAIYQTMWTMGTGRAN